MSKKTFSVPPKALLIRPRLSKTIFMREVLGVLKIMILAHTAKIAKLYVYRIALQRKGQQGNRFSVKDLGNSQKTHM